MKILVTGATGMLGSSLCEVLGREGHNVIALSKSDLDVSATAEAEATIERLRPDAVAHLAALTDVDYCETHPDDAFRVNAFGTWNVAIGCQAVNAVMFYVSTDGVYDGTKGEPYHEYDSTGPLSVYSKSKLAGEQHVRDHVAKHYILRAGWMFGSGGKDKKFVGKILKIADEKHEISAVDDKVGSPIYTLDLSRLIAKLAGLNYYGTFNAANRGACSRYEFACKIIEFSGIPCIVKPVSSDAFKLAAPRPAMTMIRNFRLQLLGLDDLPAWEDSLRSYIEVLRRAPVKEPVSGSAL